MGAEVNRTGGPVDGTLSKNVSSYYREVARRFTERVMRELHGDVQAIVLFGSVARGQATRRSDIDVMVVTPHKYALLPRLVEISEDIDAENEYRTFLTCVCFSLEQIRELANEGAPFVLNVLEEGSVLYDDGSLSRLREEILGDGRPDAGGREAHVPARPPELRD